MVMIVYSPPRNRFYLVQLTTKIMGLWMKHVNFSDEDEGIFETQEEDPPAGTIQNILQLCRSANFLDYAK